MAELRQRLSALTEKWKGLAPRLRLLLIFGALLVVGAAVFGATRSREPEMAVLFSRLSADDAARVLERLKQMNLPFRLDAEGTAILVPEDKVHETRLTLAGEGLPSGGGVGFEIFDEQKFGESEFAEQIKYHRALEGELSRTISHLAGVEKARVHLVLPNRSLFVSDEPEARASVALHLKPGWKLSEERVEGIVHLVSSSVRSLRPEQITVVDGEGRSLSGKEKRRDEAASDVLAYRREIERSKERSLQQFLDDALGPQHALVRVAADVSMASEERTEEVFNPETVATRSFEIVEERGDNANAAPQGIPGAASNLPGGEAPSSAGSSDKSLTRRSETRNFEVSKTVKRAVEPVGRLERLQVAVVVDGHWKGKGDKRRFEARSAQEMARIKALVESAAGVRAERGDRVTVECVAFARVTPPVSPMSRDEMLVSLLKRYWQVAAGVAGALLLLLLLMVWRWRRSRKRRAEEKRLLLRAEGPVPSLSGAEAMGLPATPITAALPVEPEKVHKLAADLAAEDPARTARVVRGWLAEGA